MDDLFVHQLQDIYYARSESWRIAQYDRQGDIAGIEVRFRSSGADEKSRQARQQVFQMTGRRQSR